MFEIFSHSDLTVFSRFLIHLLILFLVEISSIDTRSLLISGPTSVIPEMIEVLGKDS